MWQMSYSLSGQSLLNGDNALTVLHNAAEKFLLFPGHLTGFLLRPFVVITDKVKNTMDHQEGNHFHLVQTKMFHLTVGRLDRDDQIPQEMGMKGGESAFSHREGKDVGRFIQSEVSPVQCLNLSVIDQ
jgi:hypothetical protein